MFLCLQMQITHLSHKSLPESHISTMSKLSHTLTCCNCQIKLSGRHFTRFTCFPCILHVWDVCRMVNKGWGALHILQLTPTLLFNMAPRKSSTAKSKAKAKEQTTKTFNNGTTQMTLRFSGKFSC